MPRYFFHIIDGITLRDHEGTELPDIQTARSVAVRTSGEILHDMGERFWDGTEWHLEVADEWGRKLFVLHFLAENADSKPQAKPDHETGVSPNLSRKSLD